MHIPAENARTQNHPFQREISVAARSPPENPACQCRAALRPANHSADWRPSASSLLCPAPLERSLAEQTTRKPTVILRRFAGVVSSSLGGSFASLNFSQTVCPSDAPVGAQHCCAPAWPDVRI